MKKFLLLTGMILAMGAFQSLKAQTFSRVVTVTKIIDTISNGTIILTDSILYTVPNGKVFKLEFFTGNNFYGNISNSDNSPIYCKINGVTIQSYKNNQATTYPRYSYNPSFLNEAIWLKSGDIISISNRPPYTSGYKLIIHCFLSGIEYDVP